MNCDQETVPDWHATVYLTLFSGAAVEVPIQGSDNDITQSQAIVDIWEDLLVLHKLQQRTFLLSISAMERDWIKHQITRFHCKLFLLWSGGIRFIVCRPDYRASLVRQVYEKLGHFGIRMTHSMLRDQYYWTNIYKHVAAYVRRCEVFDRVMPSFNILSLQL